MQNTNSWETCYQHKYNTSMNTKHISKLTIDTNSKYTMHTNNYKNIYRLVCKLTY